MNLVETLGDCFREYARETALSFYAPPRPARIVTYAQLDAWTRELVLFLEHQGFRAGDVVLSYLGKSPELVAALLAVMRGGGVAGCLNSKLKPHQVALMAAQSGARYLFIDRASLDAFSRMDDTGVSTAPAAAAGGIGTSVVPAPGLPGTATTWFLVHLQVQDRTRAYRTACVPAAEDEPAFCLYTSGSTGSPKGVLIGGTDLLQRSRTEAEDFRLSRKDVLLSLLPLSFDVGLNQLLACLMAGGHLVIMNSWFPKDVVAAIRSQRVTGISGVPTLWAEMISAFSALRDTMDLSSLRYLTVSGGDLASDRLQELRCCFAAADIFKTYGQTETFRSGILLPGDFRRQPGSVGRPVRGTRVFILDGTDAVAAPGVEGEIVHHGAGTMIGYINDQEATAQKLRPVPEPLVDILPAGRVVYTGDRGIIDEEGFLFVRGREDGMIKTSGYRVYPREVEECLLKHEAVKRAAVVGIPDERKGQAIVAEAVLRGAATAGQLLSYLRKQLPSYMVPDRLHVVAGLPLSENGKIQYAEIRQKYAETRILP